MPIVPLSARPVGSRSTLLNCGITTTSQLPTDLTRTPTDILATEHALLPPASHFATLFERGLNAWASRATEAPTSPASWRAPSSASLDQESASAASALGDYRDVFRRLTMPRDPLPNATMEELTSSVEAIRDRLADALANQVPADVSSLFEPRGTLADIPRSLVLDAMFAPGASWLDPRGPPATASPSPPQAQYEAARLHWMLGRLVGFEDMAEHALRTVMGVLHLGSHLSGRSSSYTLVRRW